MSGERVSNEELSRLTPEYGSLIQEHTPVQRLALDLRDARAEIARRGELLRRARLTMLRDSNIVGICNEILEALGGPDA